MLDGVDDILHCRDVLACDEYREIGQQVGVRFTQARVIAWLPEAGCQ